MVEQIREDHGEQLIVNVGRLARRYIAKVADVLRIALFLNQIVCGIHILLLPGHVICHAEVGNDLGRVSVAFLVPIGVAIETLW